MMDGLSADVRTHVFPVRVYYEDTDAAGIVYYANYFKYAERARTEMLREMGADHQELRRKEGLGFAVRRCEADYRLPASLDDQLTVRTTIAEVRGATATLRQSVFRDGTELVAMTVQIVCMNAKGRAVRLPAVVRAAMENMMGNSNGR